MQILASTPDNLSLAAKALERGEIVGMPTETVYGLAGAAFNPKSLAQIFAAKERPTFDPLIIHVSPLLCAGAGKDKLAALERLNLVDGALLSESAKLLVNRLLNRFWPGPFTIVLPKHADVPDLATSGLATVGIRMPSHPVAQALIDAAGTALAAPSANRFGRISPTRPEHVEAELGDRISYCLDGGPCEVGVESTIAMVSPEGELTLLRPGKYSRAELESVAGQEVRMAASSRIHAPGMLESHYAPRKPLRQLTLSFSALEKIPHSSWASPSKKYALLTFSTPPEEARSKFTQVFDASVGQTLSLGSDMAEAGRKLFSAMRELDQSEADEIWVEPVPAGEETGLRHAIIDRLKRASAERP